MINTEHISAAKKLQQDSFDVLNIPEVRSRLGGYADRLSGLIERSIVVDVDDNYFMNIDKSDESSVPVIALHMGQRALLHADNSSMTDTQRESLVLVHGASGAHRFANDFARNLRQNEQHHEAPIFDRASHFAYASANHSVHNQTHMVMGRPYVAMNMEGSINGNLSPVIFLHELTHVMQKEAAPVQEGRLVERNKVRAELEAYCLAAQVIFGFMDTGRQRELLTHTPKSQIEYARKVESVRQQYQRTNDPFDPNDHMAKALIDNKLAVTTLLGDIIKQQDDAKNRKQESVPTH